MSKEPKELRVVTRASTGDAHLAGQLRDGDAS